MLVKNNQIIVTHGLDCKYFVVHYSFVMDDMGEM